MTDVEVRRQRAICEVAGVSEIDDVSDGFHTFRQLYYQRMMLFATIVKQNRDKAWKSLRHEDGELCFGGGWFIVGIDTPEGSYTYHYEDVFYTLFDCVELKCGKHWDGHTEEDVTRLLSLAQESKWIPVYDPLKELPKDRMLLVTVESKYSYRYVTDLYYDMTEWSDIDVAKNTIAYQYKPELPEPYEED